MSDLTKLTTAKLRKLAEEQEIEGWEDMEKPDLIKALTPEKEEPEEEKVDLSKLSLKELQKVAKAKGVDVKGMKKKAEVIAAIEGGGGGIEEGLGEEKEVEETPPELGAGVTGGRTPMGSKAAIMKAKLAKQKKVTILIPKDKDEKLGSTMSVILNGYRMNIVKGVYVEVPEQVARVVMKSQNQTIQALRGETTNPQSGKKKDSLLDGSEPELEE